MRSAKQIRAEHKRVCTKMEELMREGDGVPSDDALYIASVQHPDHFRVGTPLAD